MIDDKKVFGAIQESINNYFEEKKKITNTI